MNPSRCAGIGFVMLLFVGHWDSVHAAKLVEVRTVDRQHLMIHWLDGEIAYRDDGRGPKAFQGSESIVDRVIRYQPALNTTVSAKPESYTIVPRSPAASASPMKPSAVFRKTKVNGTNRDWPEAEYTLEHTIYLRLPRALESGQTYTLIIAPATNSDISRRDLTFDNFRSESEALHVNLIGYHPEGLKSADLYMWLGDGGARDYSEFLGAKVLLYNVRTGKTAEVGEVSFWKPRGPDLGGRDLTASPVWNCDFSPFREPGRYRLVVDGIGCTPEFVLSPDAYHEPFKTSVRGFFYMRMGMDRGYNPPPRQPRFIPDLDPPGFKVYRTTFEPGHPDWRAMRGDVWDRREQWARYREPGEPTNPHAWGGHSDALDWDRHAGHVSIIWDLLLPYFLSAGKLDDDGVGIAESGNGIPDLIDEARYEVDFWLRLRDGKGGYAFGLNNPNRDYRTMHQAGARPYMAWVNAANCAMLADCLRLAGQEALMARYRDEAIAAYQAAKGQDLDFSFGIGNGNTRGRDHKMMSSAFLYNLTGDRRYEDAMAEESVVTRADSPIDDPKTYCQYWGTAAYLMCQREGWQPIHHADLAAKMKASILHEATQKNVLPSSKRPSRRSSDEAYSWFQATQMTHALLIAHAVSTDPAERATLQRAMILETDYGLGRNPLNRILMTGLGPRAIVDIYTSGGNDGVPGLHPGHTPYMNAEPWGAGYQADPKWYARKGYPAWEQWPHGEALWSVRFCYANNEFTPQQTMRGKTALLGYLEALARTGTIAQ